MAKLPNYKQSSSSSVSKWLLAQNFSYENDLKMKINLKEKFVHFHMNGFSRNGFSFWHKDKRELGNGLSTRHRNFRLHQTINELRSPCKLTHAQPLKSFYTEYLSSAIYYKQFCFEFKTCMKTIKNSGGNELWCIILFHHFQSVGVTIFWWFSLLLSLPCK